MPLLNFLFCKFPCRVSKTNQTEVLDFASIEMCKY